MTAIRPSSQTGEAPPAQQLSSSETRETTVLTSLDEIEAVQAEWEAFLRERAGDHGVLQQPDIIKGDLREHSDIYSPMIVIVRNRGEIEAVAPWFVHRLRFPIEFGVIRLLRLPVRLFKLAGANLALDRDAPAHELLDQIFSAAYKLRKRFDLIALFDMPVPGLLWNYLDSAKRDKLFRNVTAKPEPQTHYSIRLPDTFDGFWSSLTSKRRNSLKRCERQLQQATANTVEVVSIKSPEQVHPFLDDVRRVYEKSWQGRTMGGDRNSEAQIRFWERVASHGWFRSHLVRADYGPICYSIGLQYQGTFYCFDTAYDIAWRRCAPGNYMFINLIRDLYAHDTPRVVDFGSGESTFKNQFSNEIGKTQTVYLVARWSFYGFFVITLQRCLYSIERRIRRVFTWLKIDRWVRDLLKHRHRSA